MANEPTSDMGNIIVNAGQDPQVVAPNQTVQANGQVTEQPAGQEVVAEKVDPNAPKADPTKVDPAKDAPKVDTWATRDQTKDVAVTPEQKLQIASMGLTPEQATAMEEFTVETNTTGDLSDASREKAAKAFGVSRKLVDQWVEGNVKASQQKPTQAEPTLNAQQQAELTARTKVVHEAAGGEQQFEAFKKWAHDGGLTKEEAEDLVASISASPAAASRAVKEYMAKFNSQGGPNGGPAVDLTRNMPGQPVNPANAVKGFATRDEQNAALRDPRYGKDPAYTQEVYKRIGATTFNTGDAGFMG